MNASATSQQCRIRLAPGRHVQAQRLRDCHVLKYPSGIVQLNESAAQILALIGGDTKLLQDEIENRKALAAETRHSNYGA